MYRTIFITFLIFLGVSCSPVKRAQRHVRLAHEHIEKAKKLDPKIEFQTVVDTVQVPVITEHVKTDTLFVPTEKDTVYISKDRLRIKYVDLPGDTVYIEGECLPDTVLVEVPVIKETFIKQESYRTLVKRILGISTVEFWILHIFLALTALVIIYAKLIKPRIVVKK